MNNYANVILQIACESLPPFVQPAGTGNWTPEDIWAAQKKDGWRKITTTFEPEPGFRAGGYAWIDHTDGETCTQAITIPINIQDEADAQAKAQADMAAAEAQRYADYLKPLIAAVIPLIEERITKGTPIIAETAMSAVTDAKVTDIVGKQ